MTSATRRALHLWTPVVAYIVAIFIVSSQPKAPIPEGMTDKQGHIAAYGGLAVLTARALAGGLPSPITIRTATTALMVSVGYGVADELHQSLVPGRTADPWDLFADATGACMGLLGCWAWGIIAARVND